MTAKIIDMDLWKLENGIPLPGQEDWWAEQDLNAIEAVLASLQAEE